MSQMNADVTYAEMMLHAYICVICVIGDIGG